MEILSTEGNARGLEIPEMYANNCEDSFPVPLGMPSRPTCMELDQDDPTGYIVGSPHSYPPYHVSSSYWRAPHWPHTHPQEMVDRPMDNNTLTSVTSAQLYCLGQTRNPSTGHPYPNLATTLYLPQGKVAVTCTTSMFRNLDKIGCHYLFPL